MCTCSLCLRDGQRKAQERVQRCCVMKCINHGMGTALLFVSMSQELFTRWQQAVINSEKNTPLCVECPALQKLFR